MTDKEKLIDMLQRSREDFYIEDSHRDGNVIRLPYEGIRFLFSPMDELVSVIADLVE